MRAPLRAARADVDPGARVVWAGTSANHQNTRRNPVPYSRREAAIAGKLAAGHSPLAIASEAQVSLSTVRVQLRSIFAKAGVGSQLELVARLAERL